jgi:hypothetical protein
VLYWDSVNSDPIAGVVADSNGSAVLSGRVPQTAGGKHNVIASGDTSRKRVTLPVTVSPKVALSPRSGKVGSSVTVDLSGYRAGEVVTVRWYTTGAATRTVRRSVTVSATGRAHFGFTVPSSTTAGSHKVEAQGDAGSKAASTYSVQIVKSASIEKTVKATAVPPTATPTPPPPTATATPPPTETPVETTPES